MFLSHTCLFVFPANCKIQSQMLELHFCPANMKLQVLYLYNLKKKCQHMKKNHKILLIKICSRCSQHGFHFPLMLFFYCKVLNPTYFNLCALVTQKPLNTVVSRDYITQRATGKKSPLISS